MLGRRDAVVGDGAIEGHEEDGVVGGGEGEEGVGGEGGWGVEEGGRGGHYLFFRLREEGGEEVGDSRERRRG